MAEQVFGSVSHLSLTAKRPARSFRSARAIDPGNNLLSHSILAALPSAVEGLTIVFGMGTCVSPHLWSPEIVFPGTVFNRPPSLCAAV